MKIKLFFNPQALKNIKPTLDIIYKLLQTQQALPNVFFIYMIKGKNIRFLIDSQKNPIVISLGSPMLNSQSTCSFKQDKQMVAFKFQNSQMFFQNLIHVLEKDDQFGLLFDIKKQVLDGKQCKFLKLTLKNNQKFVSRIAVQTPKYDQHQMKFHPWLCGCLQQKRLVEFIIYIDELMNLMRYMIKLKPSAGTKLCINFDIGTKTYTSHSSDPQCLPNVQGQLKLVSNAPSQTKFQYQIGISDLKIVHEMIRKSKQLKVILSDQYKMVFVYMKQQLFVCHIDMSQWIHCVGVDRNNENNTKIEEIEDSDHQGGMRWN